MLNNASVSFRTDNLVYKYLIGVLLGTSQIFPWALFAGEFSKFLTVYISVCYAHKRLPIDITAIMCYLSYCMV